MEVPTLTLDKTKSIKREKENLVLHCSHLHGSTPAIKEMRYLVGKLVNIVRFEGISVTTFKKKSGGSYDLSWQR